MGKTQSKKVQVSGDPQVQILNQLEIHEEIQTQHELKLNIILALVAIHLLITLYKLYKEHSRRQRLTQLLISRTLDKQFLRSEQSTLTKNIPSEQCSIETNQNHETQVIAKYEKYFM